MVFAFAAALVFATGLLAGTMVCGWLRRQGSAPSTALAQALVLGPAALAAEMLVLGYLDVPLSLPAVLGPWWIGWLAARIRRRARPPLLATAGRRPCRWRSLALVLASVPVLVVVVRGASIPVYHGDAVLNFALPARLFASHGRLAPEALSRIAEPVHPDQPPLIALNQALLFMAGPEPATHVVFLFSALALLALLWLGVEAAWLDRAPRRSFFLAVLWTQAPVLLVCAEGGYAEPRLAAALLLLLLSLRRGEHELAIAAAAAAGLTKLEGGAAAGLALLALLVYHLRARPVPARRVLAVLAAGALVASWPIWCWWHDVMPSLPFPLDTSPRPDPRLGVPLASLALVREMFTHTGYEWLAPYGACWALAIGCGLRACPWLLVGMAAHAAIYVVGMQLLTCDLTATLETTAGRYVIELTPWSVMMLRAWSERRA